MIAGAQQLEDFVELEIGLADQLVKREQVFACSLERLQRLGHLPGRGDVCIGGARGGAWAPGGGQSATVGQLDRATCRYASPARNTANPQEGIGRFTTG